MAGIQFTFNPATVSLEIQASPEVLGRKTIDFLLQRQAKVQYPRHTSAFLNYRLDYVASNGFHFENLNLTAELGARWGDFLFLSDGIYRKFPREEDWVRLISQVIYDQARGWSGESSAISLLPPGNLEAG